MRVAVHMTSVHHLRINQIILILQTYPKKQDRSIKISRRGTTMAQGMT